MILGEWPLKWKPIQPDWEDNRSGHYQLCKYGGRLTIYCDEADYVDKEDPAACKGCFMRQQSMNSYQMKRDNVFINRVCDRCKESIVDPDETVYISLQNHFGGYLLTAELCRSCAREVASWVENEAFAMPPPPRDAEAEARIAYAFARIADKEHQEYIRKKERQRKHKNEYMKIYMRKVRARQRKEREAERVRQEKERLKAERKEQTRQRANAKRRERYARKKAERLAREKEEAERE